MKKISFFAVALLTASLCGCQPEPKETQINLKVRSPDGKLTAIYAEDLGGGPATGVYEEIYIVEGNRFPRLEDRVFSNECVYDIHLMWVSPTTLRVNYSVPQGIQDDTQREGLFIWPWLRHPSPASHVRLQFVRHQLARTGC
jgi:hypothetical protein